MKKRVKHMNVCRHKHKMKNIEDIACRLPEGHEGVHKASADIGFGIIANAHWDTGDTGDYTV